MHRSQLAKRVWLLFFLVIVGSYFYGLGRIPLIGPDEPRYAQVAREMFERGDLITPRLAGHTWFEKPVLLYWMMMASFQTFGVTEFAARFGSACSGLLTILFLFWVGRRCERATDEKEKQKGLGQWSSVALATSAGLIVFSRGATTDIVLTMTVTLALSCFYVSEIERNARRSLWFLAGFYAAVGASLLAKGLVGLVIPFGIVGTYFLMRRSWPDRRTLFSLLWGIPLLIAVAAIWYGPVIALNGRLFIDEFFVQHHFARYVSNKYRHPQPIYFYPAVIILLAFPWTAFLIASFRTVRPSAWRKGDAMTRLHILALAWLIVPVAFFSLSVSKLPGYVLPALPAAALLAGEGLVQFLRGEKSRITIRVTGISVLLVAIAGLIYGRRTELVPTAWLFLMAAPFLFGGLFALIMPNQRRASVIVVACALLSTSVIGVGSIGDVIGERESSRSLIRLASARGYGDAPVYGLHTIDYTAEFYAPGRFAHDNDGKPIRFEGPQQVRKISQDTNRAVLVIVPVEYKSQLTDYAGVTSEVIGDNGSNAVVAVRAR